MQDDTMQTAFNFNDLPEKQTPLSKRALNCKKAREKRSEHAAMRGRIGVLAPTFATPHSIGLVFD